MGVPPGRRELLSRMLVREADCADRFVRRLGKLHPLWGNGTLYGAASRRALAPEVSFDDPEYCRCLVLILAQLGHRPRSEHL